MMKFESMHTSPSSWFQELINRPREIESLESCQNLLISCSLSTLFEITKWWDEMLLNWWFNQSINQLEWELLEWMRKRYREKISRRKWKWFKKDYKEKAIFSQGLKLTCKNINAACDADNHWASSRLQ